MLLNCSVVEYSWASLGMQGDRSMLKEISPEHSFQRTNAEAEAPIVWPPDVKNWLIWKDLDAGKDWRREEKRTWEDKMVGWHHRFDGHDSEQTLGAGDGQGSLVCYSAWGRQESDTTEQLNWTDLTRYRLPWETRKVFNSSPSNHLPHLKCGRGGLSTCEVHSSDTGSLKG